MEYFEARYPTSEGLATKPSIQWLGNRFPGDEFQIAQALKPQFDISLVHKSIPNNAFYDASYRATENNGNTQFTIVANWFHDFNGFIISIEDEKQNNEKFETFIKCLKSSGNFEEMTLKQYAAEHPEW